MFNDQAMSGNSNGLAIVFLLLGAPHIYSFLKHRSNKKYTFSVSKSTVSLITILVGALVILAV